MTTFWGCGGRDRARAGARAWGRSTACRAARALSWCACPGRDRAPPAACRLPAAACRRRLPRRLCHCTRPATQRGASVPRAGGGRDGGAAPPPHARRRAAPRPPLRPPRGCPRRPAAVPGCCRPAASRARGRGRGAGGLPHRGRQRPSRARTPAPRRRGDVNEHTELSPTAAPPRAALPARAGPRPPRPRPRGLAAPSGTSPSWLARRVRARLPAALEEGEGGRGAGEGLARGRQSGGFATPPAAPMRLPPSAGKAVWRRFPFFETATAQTHPPPDLK
jgi:hypothetical protein